MWAAMRIMALQLRRDVPALVLTFALPPVIFVILAAIFAGATGTELRLHVGVLDLSHSAAGGRLVAALRERDTLRLTQVTGSTEALENAVRDGSVTVGLLIRSDLQAKAAAAPIVVVGSSTRPAAASVVTGQVLRTLNEALPDVALARVMADVERAGRLDEDERAFVDRAFTDEVGKGRGDFAFSQLVEQRDATAGRIAGGPVAYYAGAVAAIFLLFAGAQGGAHLLDERQNGILARLRVGPGALTPLMLGKFLFLALQGLVQVSIIYATAALLYRVDVTGRFWAWLASAAVACAMASALGLALNAACASRQQAQLLSSFGVLTVSAVGGSMVPLYLMPPWMQAFSWLTPNAWIIAALQASLRVDADWSRLTVPWAVMGGASALALGCVLMLAARSEG